MEQKRAKMEKERRQSDLEFEERMERLEEGGDPFAIIDFWSGVNPEPIFIFDDEKEKKKGTESK